MAGTNLVTKLKQAPKNDSFRPVENPAKYNNQIALLNSTGNEQYKRVTGRLVSQDNAGTVTLSSKGVSDLSTLPKK